ncbi:MAG: DUF4386 domain-containing protein [Candidatus Promineifilaceae bacterium]
MKTRMTETSPFVYARIAGVLYLIITIAAVFAHMYMPDQLIVAGDAAKTAENILASESLFKFGGIGAELVILLSEVMLSILLYYLLKPVNQTLSLIAAVSRLAMTTIHGLNLLNYFFVLQLLKGGDFLSTFEPNQIHALMNLFLDAHSYGFTIGIAFLVPHVLILGYLIFKSGYFPKLLGVLFLLAGIGYLVDTTGLLFLPSYQTTPGIIAMVIAIAEIAFPIWLLVKGVNFDRWQSRTLALETA